MPLTAFDLFGTDEPPLPRRRLRAGPLSALLEAGQLRDIRWHGVEAVRGIAYLLRDAAWGTLPVPLTEPEVREGDDGFFVAYQGRSDGPSGRLDLRAVIEGRADGVLRFEVEALALTDVHTNRLGFVLLHPDDAAGSPLRVGHSDGSTEAMTFPGRISPDQPAFDIVSLEHQPVPGMVARVAFEGGVWEMEDQRNWSDASFKTYVRPLAWPRPYVIPAGHRDRQAVVLRLAGEPASVPTAPAAAPSGRSTMPPLHLRLADGHPVPDSLPLRGLAQGLILRVRGDAPDARRLAAAAALAAREGMALAVEALFPQRDPEAEAVACLAALEGRGVETLLVAATRDLRTRPSGTRPEGEAPLDTTLAALRRGFGERIGTGTPAFFTEFNRNPPPAADFAFFGINPIVHAADDPSVMETLRTHRAILDSAAALRPGVGLWPGPLAIPPTLNPYGPGLAQTDGRTRTCLAERDPRHGALFGAAYLLAAVAGVLPWSEAVAPLHANGPAGLVDAQGAPFPLAFVLAELAAAEGASLVPAPTRLDLAGLGWERESRRTILLANIGTEALEITCPAGVQALHWLAPGAGGWEASSVAGPLLRVEPYRTLRLTLAP